MKKILLLLTFAIFLSCETQTIEVESTGGKSYYGQHEGVAFEFGSDENTKIAVDLVLAYAEGNFELMNEMSADTVMFFEPSVGKPIPVARDPNYTFLKEIQSPYDSIQRFIWNAIPTKAVGADYETVTVSFRENRFYKTGEVEKLRVIDRIFIRDGKFFRVNQWKGIVD